MSHFLLGEEESLNAQFRLIVQLDRLSFFVHHYSFQICLSNRELRDWSGSQA